MMNRTMTRPLSLVVAILALGVGSTTLQAQRGGGAAPGPQPTQPVGAPRFEYVGPTSAGRIAAAAAVAGKPGVYYAGAASGGVWKSTDGGATWKPTFDNADVAGDRRARRLADQSEHRLGRHRRSAGPCATWT